jgi:ATP-dependent helicase/nuclease subunit B
VPHADVADTARELLQHLAEDLQRLRGGAALPALGEGRVCELCEARGLCRRDHWPDPLPETPDAPDA